MVFGKPWNEDNEHDWLTRLRTDPHLRKLLIEYGLYKSLPLFVSVAGFGLPGIVAEIFAAAAQSYLGPIAAKSFFAFLQSAGAGGAAADTLTAICNIGTARNAAGMAFNSGSKKQEKKNSENRGSNTQDDEGSESSVIKKQEHKDGDSSADEEKKACPSQNNSNDQEDNTMWVYTHCPPPQANTVQDQLRHAATDIYERIGAYQKDAIICNVDGECIKIEKGSWVQHADGGGVYRGFRWR